MSETALAVFLKERGVEPTGDRIRDLNLAKPFFKNYKVYKNELSKLQCKNKKN